MQTTMGSISRDTGRTALQAIFFIAVALAGVAFGRWIIPADSGSGSALGASGTAETSAAAAITQHKYESGTLDEVLFGEDEVLTITIPNAGEAAQTIAEYKFNSGSLQEILFGEPVVPDVSIQPEATSPAASITQRKYDSGTLNEILFGAI